MCTTQGHCSQAYLSSLSKFLPHVLQSIAELKPWHALVPDQLVGTQLLSCSSGCIVVCQWRQTQAHLHIFTET